jgi:Tfp pilus assembly protein PilX
MNNPTQQRTDRAFAMLFAVLVSSVLLSIGLSIFNLTVKEITLSSSGRESQFSFYAADTGVECALYWDFKGTNVFATSTSNRTPSPATPDCVASTSPQYINISPSSQTSSSAVTQFSLSIPNTNLVTSAYEPYCAVVTVTKTDSGGIITTDIDSRGYNTCDASDPNRVERALKVTY